ncbi:hypothetical protein [Pseudomonas fluorescens]|uniref:Uncharacterized protein n=1 Tax=Pseudomonas fluorescens TaxID=294 RepID=A0A944HJ82_PSEFL|nr:hypothetical protein [Pseudomonas fluorescens]MBT2311832.1 hypothetical protein [Pseudomonas fluorescens]MBT2316783.1 hypothetical protein [Pseudomonas fluorescens]MBT2329788.1 hypothetical protein [Pseudomonas fluorescens]MBT2344602.1 hypothetical protein [Pseudomonas fluorescens]MBT2348008.1 hypothetical protein [Pseudomonas fluorescens]
MRLSRSQITFLTPLLVALLLAGDALAQRFGNNFYAQQQMQRQQQMQQQQMQMQRQQEQMRRQQEMARQQQAAMRRQQLEQQRIMQQRRNVAIQQRQISMERHRKAAIQRQEAQSKKIAQENISSNRQATNQGVLKYRNLEKYRQERLLRLKQEFFQTKQAEKKKADKRETVRLFSLTETFNSVSGGRSLSAYQPSKVHTTKELSTQRKTAQVSAKKIQASLTNNFNSSRKAKMTSIAFNQTSKNFRNCGQNCDSTLSLSEIRKIITSAQAPYKGSTVIGHALSKHGGRHPEIWGKATDAMDSWHAQAMRHLREIVRAPGEFRKSTNDKGISFIEKRLDDGRGIRLNMDGTFKGLIE